jgi:uncharacterized DUF497 family protein
LAVSPTFEWDPAKDAQNQRKHGVAFADAKLAVISPKEQRSTDQNRFCLFALECT